MGKEAGDLKINQMKLRAEKLEGISQLEYDVEGKENTRERPHKRCWNEGWKMLKEQIWQKKRREGTSLNQLAKVEYQAEPCMNQDITTWNITIFFI